MPIHDALRGFPWSQQEVFYEYPEQAQPSREPGGAAVEPTALPQHRPAGALALPQFTRHTGHTSSSGTTQANGSTCVPRASPEHLTPPGTQHHPQDSADEAWMGFIRVLSQGGPRLLHVYARPAAGVLGGEGRSEPER